MSNDDPEVLGSVRVTLPDEPDWVRVENFGAFARASLAGEAINAHAAIDAYFEGLIAGQAAELRRVAVEVGIGPAALAQALRWLESAAMKARMQAHSELAELLDGMIAKREGEIAQAERDATGGTLQ